MSKRSSGEGTIVKRADGRWAGAISLSDGRRKWCYGKTQQEVTVACRGARPNHVGMALARHKRAGRIEERDGKLYATQSTGTV